MEYGEISRTSLFKGYEKVHRFSSKDIRCSKPVPEDDGSEWPIMQSVRTGFLLLCFNYMFLSFLWMMGEHPSSDATKPEPKLYFGTADARCP